MRRRLLGLLLIGAGLIVAVIYFSQSNPAALPIPTASATQRYYGPLVPTSLSQVTPTLRINKPTATPMLEASAAPRPNPIESTAPIGTATLAVTRTPIGIATPISATKRSSTPLAATRTPINPATRILATKKSIPPTAAIPATIAPATATVTAAAPTTEAQPPVSDTQRRMCVSVPARNLIPNGIGQLRPGWYLDWSVNAHAARPNNVEYAQMVRVPQGKPEPGLEAIGQIAQQNPGSLWLVGNEMDVIWQDNATPEQYATAYHDVYATLKQTDPNSRVAIGGISEPSPLSLQYLDRVLKAYRDQYGQEMPIEVWNVHNFILPEQRGSWGVDIPPGFDATRGLTYGIDDHDRLDIFKQQLIDFRRWMAQHGYRDKELLVTEYGVLMPADYGFDYARVRDFMLGTFDMMRTTTDPALGRPSDGNRLVQRWCWYSLADDTNYPTGNLLDTATRQLTPLGRDFKQYSETHP